MFQVHSSAHDAIAPSHAEVVFVELDDEQLASVGGGSLLPVGGWAPPDASASPVGGW